MSGKSTAILLAAAAVLFAFVWGVDRPIREERLRQQDRVILPGLDPKSIDHVELKPHGSNEIHFERAAGSDAQWQLTQPIVYPAQSGAILAMLDGLAKLEWQQRIPAAELKDQPDAQEKYGFAQPQLEALLKGAGVSERVLFGQSSPMGDQVFVEVVGRPDIYLINSDLLKLMPANKDRWRNLGLLNLAASPFQSIKVRVAGAGFDLDLNPTNHLWFMTNPVTARVSNGKISELLERLQALRVHQFVTDDPQADLELYGLQSSTQAPGLDLSFLRGTNVAAELQVGASLTNQPGLAFARRLDPSNVVVINREALRPWEGTYTNFLDYHFISLPPGDIGTIAVQDETPFVVQKQTNGQWQVLSDPAMPVDAELMQAWLAAFTNIQTRIEKTVATDLRPYGLKRPALQYTLQAAADAKGASNTMIAQIQFGIGSNGVVFERRMDESSVNSISTDDFTWLPRTAWQLRDRRVWSFNSSNVVSLTIHQKGETRKYVRDPEGEWTFAPGYHGPPLVNWTSLEEGVYRLSQLRAVYWSDAGGAASQDFGFANADFSLDLEIKSGGKIETRSIEFGGRSPYSYPYASVAQNGQRLIFEFPVDLYENFVEHDMTIPATLQGHR